MSNPRILFLLVFPLVVMLGWLGWQEVKAQGADWLPIKYIRVEGAFQYIAKDQIKQVLKEQVSTGLYNTDIQQISESVQHLSWVNDVTVKRVWPDSIDIKIKEQRPIVRWKNEGLVNSNGEIFAPDNVNEFTHLPILAGPAKNEKVLLNVMIEVASKLNNQNLKLTEFRVSNRRAWYIKCQNDMQLILGRNKPRNKLQRFLKTLPIIGEQQKAKIAIADLRYPNGYALKWKQGVEEIDWKKIVETRKIKWADDGKKNRS